VHADPAVHAMTIGLGLAVVALAARNALRHRVWTAVWALVAVAGIVALTELAKLAVSRPVIEGTGDGSFPSGTATWSLAVSGICVLLLKSRHARWLAAPVAAVVVVALAAVIIWERWHYPSDVLAGWCLAVGWIGAVWLASGRSERESSRRLLGEHPPDRE
jgi:membrane-associated phospholipid phosphatase